MLSSLQLKLAIFISFAKSMNKQKFYKNISDPNFEEKKQSNFKTEDRRGWFFN